MPPPDALAAAGLECGNCGAPMRALRLAGHYGREVEVDLCAACHLVWFDPVESARLAGPGLLALIGEMAAAQALPHLPARPDLRCPRCRGALHEVHNRTRFGRSRQLECAAGHGAWQTFGQYLAEKGLLRPMSSADRARALRHDGSLACVNCGGAVGAQDEVCPWCGSVPALVDVARLAQALDPEGATRGHAVHALGSDRTAMQCLACGAAQPADGGWRCVQCQATLAAPALAEAHRAVSALGPALQAHAARPAPHVVRERLAALQPALERQRERAAQMQAEADQQLGRIGARDAEPVARGPTWSDLADALSRWTGWPPWAAHGVLAAALLLLAWWLLH
jgi:Zn-finger nucleic acid-binding protein